MVTSEELSGGVTGLSWALRKGAGYESRRPGGKRAILTIQEQPRVVDRPQTQSACVPQTGGEDQREQSPLGTCRAATRSSSRVRAAGTVLGNRRESRAGLLGLGTRHPWPVFMSWGPQELLPSS